MRCFVHADFGKKSSYNPSVLGFSALIIHNYNRDVDNAEKSRPAFPKKVDGCVTYFVVSTSISLCASLLISMDASPTESADSNPAVRNTRLYDPGDGYDDPSTPSIVS